MAISDVSVGVMMDNLNVLPRYNQCVVVILVVYHDAPNKIIHRKFRGGLKKCGTSLDFNYVKPV